MIINFDRLGGGGGSGTSNYNDLSNKPQVNGVTLSGNKSLHDLGAQAELVAGTGIQISGNTISFTGSTGGEVVTIDMSDPQSIQAGYLAIYNALTGYTAIPQIRLENDGYIFDIKILGIDEDGIIFAEALYAGDGDDYTKVKLILSPTEGVKYVFDNYQDYTEVETEAERDALNAKEGDIAVVSAISENILTLSWVQAESPILEPGITYTFTKKPETAVDRCWVGVGFNDDYGFHNYSVRFFDGNWYKDDGTGQGSMEEWGDEDYTFVVPEGVDVWWSNRNNIDNIPNTFGLVNEKTNVGFVYNNGEWVIPTDKGYVDNTIDNTYNKVLNYVNGNFVQSFYSNSKPIQYANPGTVGHSNETGWVKMSSRQSTDGWVEYKDINIYSGPYANVQQMQSDLFASSNGNIAEVLGEITGSTTVSVMSQDLLMNPSQVLQAGKTYTFSQTGMPENEFEWQLYYIYNNNFYFYGVKYWDSNWYYCNGTNSYDIWDGEPFSFTIPLGTTDFGRNQTSGDWTVAYNWFDLTTLENQYGPSTWYMYRNGWVNLDESSVEVAEFEDIDAAKGLSIYAAPQNYVIKVDITDSEDDSDAYIKTVGTTHTIYRYMGDATMQGVSLRVYLCSLNGMIATYTKLILVAPDGSLISDQGQGVTDFTMRIVAGISENTPDDCIPTVGAVKNYVDDLVGNINNELDSI